MKLNKLFVSLLLLISTASYSCQDEIVCTNCEENATVKGGSSDSSTNNEDEENQNDGDSKDWREG